MRVEYWNYRVTHESETVGGESFDTYEIRRVYYTADGHGSIWASDAASPYGETPQELAGNLAAMVEALSRPVFELDVVRP